MVTRRRLRSVLTALGLYLAAALLIGYFWVNAFTGDHGLNARQNIEKAIAEFEKNTEGVRVDASVDDLRLSGIEFDSRILRVIAEAAGSVRVAVTSLPAQ